MNTVEIDDDYPAVKPKGEPWWIIALKWIALLPGAVFAYFIATILSNWGASYYSPDLVHDVMGRGDFGGHYIIGPIYIFQVRAVAAGAFVAFAVWLAPSHKAVVFGICSALYVLWILALIFTLGALFNEYGGFAWEPLIRMLIEVIAGACGVVVGGLVALEEAQTNNKSV